MAGLIRKEDLLNADGITVKEIREADIISGNLIFCSSANKITYIPLEDLWMYPKMVVKMLNKDFIAYDSHYKQVGEIRLRQLVSSNRITGLDAILNVGF